ncbi:MULTISPECIES: TetR/AcrR family transcriptional regulator [Solirubrobacterales]|uniref:TetR/AcrR family transcriptional regulator n=1 Tax=Solirubrobacterales TaxID=588673 RepID=UPI0018EEAB44|nr:MULTISPECIES: TetR/AcrR family transcriptional regulator [Solirubrobacterales]
MTTAEGPPAGKRERTKAANRRAILDAALEVFGDLGYGAATVRDIVRRTELATGTFYNYFPDKESVLRALLEDAAPAARARVRQARLEGTSVEEFISNGYRAYYAFLVEDRRLLAVLRRNAGTIRSMIDEPALGSATEDLADDIRRGIAAGYLPDVDPEVLAGAMVGAGFEIGVRMLDDDAPDVEAAVAFVSAIFVGGLRELSRRTT